MTERTRVRALLRADAPLSDVRVCGWVRSVRESKTCAFIELNDGSSMGSLQVVVPTGHPDHAAVRVLGTGAAVDVTGDLVPSPAQGQAFELTARTVTVVGPADESYPLQKKRHTFEYLRTIAHLRPRSNTFGAVFRVRNTLAYAIHRFFQERGFLYVHTPIITGSDCEGAGEMFTVTTLPLEALPKTEGQIDFSQDFFGQRTGLTVSGQLEAELFALAFGDVYTFGPTFRAENSNTARHVAEFWMIEPEMAFADLRADLRLAEDFVRFLARAVLDECEDDLQFFSQRIDKEVLARLQALVGEPYEVLTYAEAVRHLEAAPVSFEYPVGFGRDLQAEHERYLTEQLLKRPVFVIDYPKEIKAFYMRQNDDGRTVAAMDLLVPKIGEIIGGSQREERLDVLERRIREQNLPLEAYGWYLDSRRYGSVPHAGFGMGFERMIMYVTGMANIRDVIPFPRTPGHAEF
jgi:asparaginyl-tRNA synthetase